MEVKVNGRIRNGWGESTVNFDAQVGDVHRELRQGVDLEGQCGKLLLWGEDDGRRFTVLGHSE